MGCFYPSPEGGVPWGERVLLSVRRVLLNICTWNGDEQALPNSLDKILLADPSSWQICLRNELVPRSSSSSSWPSALVRQAWVSVPAAPPGWSRGRAALNSRWDHPTSRICTNSLSQDGSSPAPPPGTAAVKHGRKFPLLLWAVPLYRADLSSSRRPFTVLQPLQSTMEPSPWAVHGLCPSSVPVPPPWGGRVHS